MLNFINKQCYTEINGYDIELINLTLKDDINKRRVRLIKDHLKINIEKEYFEFLNKNISVVFKTNYKIINLYYAYEAVKQNFDKEIYEKYLLKATIIGQLVDNGEEKDILLMEHNEQYGIYVVYDKYIKKIGNSFKEVFTDGIGAQNF